MNDFDEELAASVTQTASFGAGAVADRVARRRRGRRVLGAAAVGVVAAVGVGSAIAWLGGDEPDLEAVDAPPTSSTPVDPEEPKELTPVVEDPVGADGVTGDMSDLHVETIDVFGFVECGADGEPGPPAAERAAELEAVIESLRDGGLHDQPFVTSSGGPQSIWGVPSVGLDARYEPTLRWISDRVDPADVCIEFPEYGLRNLPPTLAAVTVTDGFTVTADGCEPKGEWVEPFMRLGADRLELGIAIGRGQQVFVDDCPQPTTHVFSVRSDHPATIASEPGTVFFDAAVVPGSAAAFTYDPVNAASATTGDDLIAQHADDPTVQFQVSDIFGGSPVAGAVGELATDQWPATGAGSIVVPEGVPAGTYHVHLIDAPELNGTLEVAGSVGIPGTGDEGAMGLERGWFVPDLDGDGERDQVDGANGQVFLTFVDGVTPIQDAAGDLISVPVDGDRVFTCNPDGRLLEQWDAPLDDERFSRRLTELVVEGGVGEWVPSPSFVFSIGEAPLPARGTGCEQFGASPAPQPVADGAVSDVHVEATDMVFPDCPNPLDPPPATPERTAELEELRTRLWDDGLSDPTMFLATSSISGDRIQIGLYRRYGPMVDFLAERAEVGDICYFIIPPVGAFTGRSELLQWVVDESTVDGPDDTSFDVVNAADCGVIYKEVLLPPQVAEFADRIEIAVPLAPRFGPSISPCLERDRFEISLDAPIGDRAIVPSDGATVELSPDMAIVPFDTSFTVVFDPAGLGGATTMGDDVMLQSVGDPSIQVQIEGVFGGAPIAGEPRPIVQDRWAATGSAQLVVPADTPPGDYTFMFIEHPQFWGTLTNDG